MTLISSLNEVAELYPSFNRMIALKQLESLGAINPDVTSASIIIGKGKIEI